VSIGKRLTGKQPSYSALRIFCMQNRFFILKQNVINPNKNYSGKGMFFTTFVSAFFSDNMNDSPRNHLQNSTRERSEAVV
jgi:hypothetical protein